MHPVLCVCVSVLKLHLFIVSSTTVQLQWRRSHAPLLLLPTGLANSEGVASSLTVFLRRKLLRNVASPFSQRKRTGLSDHSPILSLRTIPLLVPLWPAAAAWEAKGRSDAELSMPHLERLSHR